MKKMEKTEELFKIPLFKQGFNKLKKSIENNTPFKIKGNVTNNKGMYACNITSSKDVKIIEGNFFIKKSKAAKISGVENISNFNFLSIMDQVETLKT